MPDIAALTYSAVTGRILVAVRDGDDTSQDPDGLIPTGTVTFTPRPVRGHVGDVDPTVVLLDSITVGVDPGTGMLAPLDASGQPIPGGVVRLVATDNDALAPNAWTYQVTASLTLPNYDSADQTQGYRLPWAPFDMPAPAVGVDISEYIPVGIDPSTGATIVRGPKGDKGDTGDDSTVPGPPGPGNALTIGTVTSDTTAGATITGSSPTQTLNLVIPKGEKGDKGDKGNDGAGLPTGGTTGQIPARTSDGGSAWIDPDWVTLFGLTAAQSLDALTTPGVYTFTSTSATTGNNFPVASKSCVIEVMNFGNQTTYAFQRITYPDISRIFTRGFVTSWSSWVESAPTTAATGTVAGLMSAADKAKLDAATSTAATPGTIAMRTAAGAVPVGTPTATTHATTKTYVDTADAATEDAANTYADGLTLTVGELAYVEMTVDYTVIAGTSGTYASIPGMTITFTMPDAAVYLVVEAMTSIPTTQARGRLRIVETTASSAAVMESHLPLAPTGEFSYQAQSKRITGGVGTTRTFALQAYQTGAAWTVKGGPLYPFQLRAERK